MIGLAFVLLFAWSTPVPQTPTFSFLISFSWYIFITDGKTRLFLRVFWFAREIQDTEMSSIEMSHLVFCVVCLSGWGLASSYTQCYTT